MKSTLKMNSLVFFSLFGLTVANHFQNVAYSRITQQYPYNQNQGFAPYAVIPHGLAVIQPYFSRYGLGYDYYSAPNSGFSSVISITTFGQKYFNPWTILEVPPAFNNQHNNYKYPFDAQFAYNKPLYYSRYTPYDKNDVDVLRIANSNNIEPGGERVNKISPTVEYFTEGLAGYEVGKGTSSFEVTPYHEHRMYDYNGPFSIRTDIPQARITPIIQILDFLSSLWNRIHPLPPHSNNNNNNNNNNHNNNKINVTP